MLKPLPERTTCDDTNSIRNHTVFPAAQQRRNQDIIAEGDPLCEYKRTQHKQRIEKPIIT